ncbi:subunit of TIM23 translocase complex [Tieghemiomyces parasiticus]|uniref:Subunit of TIM23 translocase complex n=1 Tax=Tieghemiomyces parasiticus TaxID=78921 RepID=A0A9W7ZNI8_9FUNG|nr:subunit of TIM23 translocase complex [Tieghemiomyces parasiticus]
MAEPSAWDKMKLGALMGTTVGLGLGAIFGIITILRVGPGPKGYLSTMGQYMLSSGATFGFFMSIGSVIRTEGKFQQPRLLGPQAVPVHQLPIRIVGTPKPAGES